MARADQAPLSAQVFQVLLSLVDDDLHGYALIQDIEQRTGGEMRLGTGTLYTAIARLVELGLIEDTGRTDERRRYYRLTSFGGQVLALETGRLERLLAAARQRQANARPARSGMRDV